MQWSLEFRESAPVTVEVCEQALAAFCGGPVATDAPPMVGNPRDGFSRVVTLSGERAGVRITLKVAQDAWGSDWDPESQKLSGATLDGETFATKLATWHALRDAFAARGWTDRTLVSFPSWIVDDAVAAGEHGIAAQLRAEITAARIAEAKAPAQAYEVNLNYSRVNDANAVLEAYVDVERIIYMKLGDCGLRALPKAFARFPRIEILDLDSNQLDASVLRGVSLPALYMMSMSYCPLESLRREDVAGFPLLSHVSLNFTKLRELDAAIVEACPKLSFVDVRATPLAVDAARLGTLRAAWPNVKILAD